MFDKIQIYHFVLKNGREFFGRVIDQDGQKIMIELEKTRKQPGNVILYHDSLVLAEPIGWKAKPGFV